MSDDPSCNPIVRNRMRFIAFGLLLIAGGCRSVRPASDPHPSGVVPAPPHISWLELRVPKDIVDATGNAHRRSPNHPDGIAVRNAGGDLVPLLPIGVRGAIEIWEFASEPLGGGWISGIDPGLIKQGRGFVLVSNAAADDPPSDLNVPRRRAIDAVILEPSATPSAGTAIVMSSLARQTPPEQAFMADLLGAGFTVMTTAPPVNAIDRATGGRTTLDIEADPELAGRMFAAEVDLAFTAWADGLKAVLTYLGQTSDITPSPLVLIGVSSGAVAAPIVAARLHEDFPIEVAVLIAGGSDVASILLETTLDPEDLRLIRRGDRSNETDAAVFASSYHRSVRLDSAAIVEWLGRRPVLLLEGGYDRAIPSSSRSLLDRRLGRPERWWYPVGHYGLFFILPGEGDAIVDWIRRSLRPIIGPSKVDMRSGNPALRSHEERFETGTL
ncbi:MAG: hypothetical protein O3A19_04945 [Planctomycetota bacterium]|nr:hypothetical protein [Planctomycetota bacterium]